MRAVIIDDDNKSVESLFTLLNKFCSFVTIVGTCTDVYNAKEVIETSLPDLVFLDIEMPGKDGITFLREIHFPNFEVIFVTAHDDYILQALRLAAVDYLLKPVDPQELMNAVELSKSRIESRSLTRKLEVLAENLIHKESKKVDKICLSDASGYHVIALRDILYLCADNTYTTFFLTDGRQMLMSRPLMDYERLLPDAQFFRIHKSYLINLSHVTGFKKSEGGSVLLSNGQLLEVSRRKKDELLDMMKEMFLY